MFLKNINNQNFLFSGGRFGFSGFKPIKGKLNLQTYFEVIEESLDFLNLSIHLSDIHSDSKWG